MMSGMRNEAGDAEAGLSAQIDDAVVICFDDRHLQIILVEENDIGLPPVCKLYAIHCERVLQAVEKGLDDSRVYQKPLSDMAPLATAVHMLTVPREYRI